MWLVHFLLPFAQINYCDRVPLRFWKWSDLPLNTFPSLHFYFPSFFPFFNLLSGRQVRSFLHTGNSDTIHSHAYETGAAIAFTYPPLNSLSLQSQGFLLLFITFLLFPPFYKKPLICTGNAVLRRVREANRQNRINFARRSWWLRKLKVWSWCRHKSSRRPWPASDTDTTPLSLLCHPTSCFVSRLEDTSGVHWPLTLTTCPPRWKVGAPHQSPSRGR